MRKICIFVLVVLLVGVLALPAFATSIDSYTYIFSSGSYSSSSLPSAGDYVIEFYKADGTKFFSDNFSYSGNFFGTTFMIDYSGSTLFADFFIDPSAPSFILDINPVKFDGYFVLIPSVSENLSPLGGITDVFGQIGSFVVFALGSLVSLFWTGSSLTFIGVLGVCGLAVGVILLIVYLVARYLRFRSG